MGRGGTESARFYDVTEHKMTVGQLKEKFATSLDEVHPQDSLGLSVQDAAARLKKDGPNAMTPPKQTPEIVKFLLQFTSTFMSLLMVAAALLFISYSLDTEQKVNMYCGIALCIIIVVQSTASYLEERKGASAMNSLKSMMPAQCYVIRDGKPHKIPAAELVVGDVVHLKVGDRVPADVRILQTCGLKVESSSVTGEADAFEMGVEATHDLPHESKNLCFNTSHCTEGSAVCVVIRTGDQTLAGRVATLANATSGHDSTLRAEINRSALFITLLALTLAIIILIIGASQKMKWALVANLVITIFVANVPQGLPATVASCLVVAANRLCERNVLVKNLEVIETLGCATCIASDKTGTLTLGVMSVQNFWFNGSFEMLGGGVVVGAASAVMSAGPTSNPNGDFGRDTRGNSTAGFTRLIFPGAAGGAGRLPRVTDGKSAAHAASVCATSSEATNALVRWKGNPLEPMLLVAAVCNSARFAATEELVGAPASNPHVAPGSAAKLAEVRRSAPEEPMSKHCDETDMKQNWNDSQRVVSGESTQGTPRALAVTRIEHPKLSTNKVIGIASEAALLRYCQSIYPVDDIRKMYPRAFDQPFNPKKKYALCVVTPPNNEAGPGKQYVFLQGVPEVVMARCSNWLCQGRDKAIDEDFKQQFDVAFNRFVGMGERVLGFARLVVDAKPDSEHTQDSVPNQGFVFLGLASLIDPPKVGVDKAVDSCRSAGIRVFMFTGDHALTAEAIAHRVHIITKPTRADLAHERGVPMEDVDAADPEIGAVVIRGADLFGLDEDGWKTLLSFEEVVFAHTSPRQKLEIVERLQARGEVVAVVGDGVNDAPALKKAQIGVAMGNANASDVARDAADMIIMDDDFCSLVDGIREGRLLFDNLKKSVAYTLTHLVPEMVPVLINIILLMPLGLSPMLILIIDLGSELVPAISLAYEEPELDTMFRPPRNIKKDRMVTKQVIFHSYLAAGAVEGLASILAYCCVFWSYGVDLHDLVFPDSQAYWTENAPVFHSNGKMFTADEQVTILSIANAACYCNIVLCQLFHIWFCRTRATSVTKHPLFSNKLTLLSVPWELAFIAIFCYIPSVSEVSISGYGLPGGLWCLSLGFLIWVAIHTELLKWGVRRTLRGHKSCLANFAW